MPGSLKIHHNLMTSSSIPKYYFNNQDTPALPSPLKGEGWVGVKLAVYCIIILETYH